jgi:uncharacterized protein YyaL (SSP411 family)
VGIDSFSMHTNRLIHEKSPYLLQHAHNPVEWFPWGEEAFDKARQEDKPIFLSIGYSTCHWCHVMERECFEDPEVASLMNDAFVSIKVDREERPEIDNIYMIACQMMTGGGGWPLTVIMTPDKKPFFAGTYFPKRSHYGRPGMLDLIPRLKGLWLTRREDVVKSALEITEALRRYSFQKVPAGPLSNEQVLSEAYAQLSRTFDPAYGGFGDAPKFPSPHQYLFLLRYWKRTGSARALEMVEKSLSAMEMGGIHDHLGHGFHRYSTDSRWLVPHFEKMLYDQALLSLAYTEAFQATGKREYGDTARSVLDYVLRDMTAPEGGFYSAEDADSEGVEGKFYLWSEEELEQVLSPQQAELIKRLYHTQKDGNFSEETGRSGAGANILYRTAPSPPDQGAEVEEAFRRLFAEREKRMRPGRDDKILTDWNGLMIATLARAAQTLQEPQYAHAAQRAADFLLERMRTSDGALLHRYRKGDAAICGNIDDYQFMILGCVELYEAIFDPLYLRAALELNDITLKQFWDPDGGGFFFTSSGAEELIVRQKEIYDGAVPSGNSVALWNLLRLARLTGSARLEEKAEELVRAFVPTVSRAPVGFTQFLIGLDYALGPALEIVVSGKPGAKDTDRMLQAIRSRYIPNKVVLLRPDQASEPEIVRLAPYTGPQQSLTGKATAYVCRNQACREPTTDPAELIRSLP